MTTVVVIGKITAAEAGRVIGKYFGSWSSKGPKPDTNFPPAPNNKPSYLRIPDDSRVQDEVIMAQTLSMTRTDPDYYALELGNKVLGGAFYATRLYP